MISLDTLTMALDEYEIKARLMPAALVVTAPLFSLGVWIVPRIAWEASVPLVTALSVMLIYVVAVIMRARGSECQQGLFNRWGGTPTVRLLTHRDRTLDAATKGRYHAYLNASVPGLTLPTPEQEAESPRAFQAVYQSAGQWLREQRRDRQRFYLVIQANITYGFWRNLWCSRHLGLGLALLSLGGNGLQLWLDGQGRLALVHIGWIWGAIFVSGLMSLFFLWGLQEKWVRNAAYDYARTLLQTCDAPADPAGSG